ncbi:MAG: ribosome biogenesis GTPase [Lentimonas sp.]|jgi:ribosome biogenesis GTPase
MAEIGRILKSTGSWYNVLLPDGETITCRLRGKIRLAGLKTTNPVAVGDEVTLSDVRDDENRGMIISINPRKNYLVRKSTNLSKQMQILASNIDRVYLMVTLKSPDTQIAFIDRFLVSAESFRIPCTLIFNKMDIYDEEDKFMVDALIDLYAQIGYPSHKISTINDENLDFLKKEINGNSVMIGGHSGVGKSTLINHLDSSIHTKTGEISKAHQQGQHTTTFAEMYPLKTGGFIIDTPGIRAFGIVDLQKEHISHYFPEFRERMGKCKFNNCKHINEPKCIIKEDVENGKIAETRYYTYQQLMTEDANDTFRKNDHV